MLRFWKKGMEDQEFLYEEKPELTDIELSSENIKNQIGDSDDVVFRSLHVNGKKELPVSLIFIDGMINTKNIDDDILKPLFQEKAISEAGSQKEMIDFIFKGGIYHNSVKIRDKIDETIEDLITGYAALVFDEEKTAITFEVKGFEKRSISEPTGENVLKGAKDSFIEVLRVNTSLIRRKIKNQNLRIKQVKVGRQTITDVAVVWIEGIANHRIIDEVLKRINSIQTDGALATGSIEEFIIDSKWSSFPQISYTERPDKLSQNLMDGRVAIIVDGLPTALIVPVVYNMFFQAPEDYSNSYLMASFIRLLRYASYFITLFLPGFYIAITTFHQEMIPTELVVAIAQSKEGVPFPTFVEVLMMLFAFELLIEAGLRLPKNIGQAVSIVGGVVVGQAAVEAKLVSPGVVIIIALSAICGFSLPNQDFSNTTRLWRLVVTMAASISGLYGVVIIEILMIYKAAQIETYGVPYLSPFVANEGKELAQDTLIRLPMFLMKKRPTSLKSKNSLRQREQKGKES